MISFWADQEMYEAETADWVIEHMVASKEEWLFRLDWLQYDQII